MTTPLIGMIGFITAFLWVLILAFIYDCNKQAVHSRQWHLALSCGLLFVIFFSVPVVLGILHFTNGGAP